MKLRFFLLLPIVALISCHKEKPVTQCTTTQIPFDYSNPAKTLIPIDTRNFWTYTDSIFSPQTGAFDSVTTTLIKIEDVYQNGSITYFDFTELLPPMTAIGDTLYSVQAQKDVDLTNCNTITKLFYAVADTTQWGGQQNQIAYYDAATLKTPAGDFSGNVIFKDGPYVTYTFHKGEGLIKLSMYLANNQLRRSLTLKDYKVY